METARIYNLAQSYARHHHVT